MTQRSIANRSRQQHSIFPVTAFLWLYSYKTHIATISSYTVIHIHWYYTLVHIIMLYVIHIFHTPTIFEFTLWFSFHLWFLSFTTIIYFVRWMFIFITSATCIYIYTHQLTNTLHVVNMNHWILYYCDKNMADYSVSEIQWSDKN